MCAPWIPPELISLIIIKLWEGLLSSDERSASLQNIVLVNRNWLALIAPIASHDVHLFNYRNANAFLTSIPKSCYHRDLFSSAANKLVNETSRSITFHANGNPSRSDLSNATPTFWESFDINQAIACVMRRVTQANWLPNLQHISFRYTDWIYDDIIRQAEYGYLPRQVTHLSVDYSFTAPAASAPSFESPMVLEWTCNWYRHSCFSASIRRLSLSGMPVGLVAIMLQLVCPKVETLELAHRAQLAALVPLPPTMRTLVLCHPGVAVCKETMASWGLDTALDVGLYPKGSESKLRIVLRRTCQCFNVELVYERDDSQSRAY
ncbi:hypothetical protein V8D89_000305 [Ganoderma adspersum]